MTKVLSEIVNDNENNQQKYILFIDEIHSLISSKKSLSANAVGEINIAEMLKPALARGKIQCIGATTRDEYVKYFQNDAALGLYVDLSHKYIPYRNFPDKAIDLIDEACSKVVLNSFRDKLE